MYHHFGGKPEVYLALINKRFQNASSQIGEIAKKDATPKEKLRNLMVGMLVFLEESQEYRLVQELVLFKNAFIPELEEAIKHKKSNTSNTVSFIENIISDGIKCGEFRENADVNAAAIAALGLFSGIKDPRPFAGGLVCSAICEVVS